MTKSDIEVVKRYWGFGVAGISGFQGVSLGIIIIWWNDFDLVFGVPHLPIHRDQLSDNAPNKTDEKDCLCDNDFLFDMLGKNSLSFVVSHG